VDKTRFPRFVLLCASWLLIQGCAEPPVAPSDILNNAVSSVPTSEIATSLVGLTNNERAAVGVPALSTNSRLTEAAQLQAAQMAAARELAHTLPAATYPTVEDRLTAAGYQWQSYAENIASGYSNATQTMSGWMGSTGHRANILNAGFTEIGTGYALDSAGQPYYVQVFGTPR
jgi:uncharacterized protein YkwD